MRNIQISTLSKNNNDDYMHLHFVHETKLLTRLILDKLQSKSTGTTFSFTTKIYTQSQHI